MPIQRKRYLDRIERFITNFPIQINDKKAGNPAVFSLKTRGFPTPPHDGCGIINFPFLIGKQAFTQCKLRGTVFEKLLSRKLPAKRHNVAIIYSNYYI